MNRKIKSLAVSLVLALLLTGGALTALGAGTRQLAASIGAGRHPLRLRHQRRG